MSGFYSKNGVSLNLIFGGVVVLTIATGALTWFTFGSFDDLLDLRKKNEEVVKLQGVVAHYDEVLTMSARMAASTGSVVWEARYRRFEPELDRTIRKLIELQPKTIHAAEETNVANMKLVEMENRGFELVRKKRRPDAFAVLFSKEYESQKLIYARGMANLNDEVNSLLKRETEGHHRKIVLLRILLSVFLIGSFLGWLFALQTIGRWNARLGSINEELDAQVKAHTVRLLSASKMSALGEMAGGIAHEINTPLSIIALRAEEVEDCLMEGEVNLAEISESMDVIKKTVNRMTKIIGGLKFFAREGGNLPFRRVAVSELVDDTLAFCSERFRNFGVNLEVIRGKNYEILQVECRSVEISQVLLNLLNNAYEAVETLKEKWVRIEASERGEYIEICVTDSGTGIPQDLREKIMQPFFTTKEIGKGTGLGLSVSAGIIAAHQGELFLDKDGPHTKFTVLLPMTQRKGKAA